MSSNTPQELRFDDDVLRRVVQILQEALLTGVDCTDLLRQVRVIPAEGDEATLILSPAYREHVKNTHQKMLEQAEELKRQHANKTDKYVI